MRKLAIKKIRLAMEEGKLPFEFEDVDKTADSIYRSVVYQMNRRLKTDYKLSVDKTEPKWTISIR